MKAAWYRVETYSRTRADWLPVEGTGTWDQGLARQRYRKRRDEDPDGPVRLVMKRSIGGPVVDVPEHHAEFRPLYATGGPEERR